jgi:hypothetical protein
VRSRLLIVSALALVCSATASAGFTPAWSYLSPVLRAKLANQAGGTLYLPARTPLGYRYRAGALVSKGKLTVPFTRRVRVSQGVYRWTKDTFLWHTQPFKGTCTSFAAVDKTLQVSGNKVYWSSSAGVAWRCVTDRLGRQLVLSATGGTALTDSPLSTVVASGLDVSMRTTAVRTALTVRPTTVRRGKTVLVQGLAGGCAETDTVTILSHAFPATHSFASVPAVYAGVGPEGRFSAKTWIPASRAPGRYTITARCGGGNLGVEAILTVTR